MNRSFLRSAGILVALILSTPSAFGAPGDHRATLEFQNLSGFTGNDSFIQVREKAVEGDHINFSDLGVRTAQIPGMNFDYRFSERNSMTLRLRSFLMSGNRDLNAPVNFNGATLAPGQTLQTSPAWYSFAAFYGRSWTAGEWNLRGLIGIEYTSIDFKINKGHAAVTAGSDGTETREQFLTQEIPVPTIGVEARRRLSRSIVAEGELEGNWINRWNSLRKEGGTIYLSQSKIESHLRFRLADGDRFQTIHPMFGVFVQSYRQHEISHEDDNMIRFTIFGPEIGVGVEF